jgi:hypothetical protein
MSLVAFGLGAVLTTPEVVTQVLMAFPLLLLCEISVWITYWERQTKSASRVSGALYDRERVRDQTCRFAPRSAIVGNRSAFHFSLVRSGETA